KSKVQRPFQNKVYRNLFPNRSAKYCKQLNFRVDLIFANRLRFAKNRPREQFGQYVNTIRKLHSIREN
ncbi:MAG: hypothetical protein PV344_05310, partial [Anaplasma sp.]|nr:hypothetical protein [Anaplasma sp.]